jgi:hypothetical protein
MLPVAAAAVLLGVLSGACPEALAQGGDGNGGDPARLGEVERRVEEAEDVIVEQVLALRRRVEALERRERDLEAAAPATTRTSPERLR